MLDLLTRATGSLVGLSAFDLNGLLARLVAHAKPKAPQTHTCLVEMKQ